MGTLDPTTDFEWLGFTKSLIECGLCGDLVLILGFHIPST